MGKITLGEIGNLGSNLNTANQYDNEIDENLLIYKLDRLSAFVEKACSDNYVCYLMGMGGRPKNVYTHLKKEVGKNLVWYRSVLPGFSRWLSGLVASHAGLMKVVDFKSLPKHFLNLGEQSIAGLYVFPKEYESTFIERVKDQPTPKEYDFGIKQFADYFYYIVDSDNYESSTGIYEIVSYGKKASYVADYL